MIAVRVAQVGLDPATNSPVVLLREEDGDRVLPILIGPAEAGAIAMELQGLRPQRPMTHDLVKRLILGLGGELRRVLIADLREDTYFAELELVREGEVIRVDARPSDGIAVALRFQAPIFLAEALLEGRSPAANDPPPPDGAELLRTYLENLDPQDLGRFQP
ncbi:MAG: bifunctional nuclease family protein [Gemmatimonadota bacterium]|nr:bifunctional nuclease family protein [Gemmatimonadota bacterium]